MVSPNCLVKRSQAHIVVPSPLSGAAQHAAQRIAEDVQNAVLLQGLDVMGAVVQRTKQENRPENTKLAYDQKAAEFYQFCSYFSKHVPLELRYTVTNEKLYAFLVYQAYREQRKRGGAKRRPDGSSRPSEFDPVEYETIFSKYCAINLENEEISIPDPENPVGYDCMNIYKSVVRKIWEGQVTAHSNNVSWDLIYDGKCKALLAMVKNRKRRISRKQFLEKLDGEFTPFTTVEQVPDIENWFWMKGKTNSRSALTCLRNRFAFLQCYAGILRHESVFLAELSDLLAILVPRAHEDTLFISILQLELGKTVSAGGHRQFGRALRHKNVHLCPVGALGMYLFQRFRLSGEMEDGRRPDFCNNSEWFRIKLMTDGTLENEKELQKSSYVNQIRKCFNDLRIVASHFGHWGRVSGPIQLEFAEVEAELIRLLGNWDAKIQETRYSSKIPMKALRVMAGFGTDEKHLNPRTRVVPSRELQDMIWPWVEPEIERIHEKRGLDTRSDFGVTALAFLVFLRHLRNVILQDAAVMLLERAERQEHVYFRSSVFVSEEFGRFKDKMKEELAKGTDVVRATVEEAMPGVKRQFDEVFKKIDMVERKVDSSAVVALRVLDRMNGFQRAVCGAAQYFSQNSDTSLSITNDPVEGDRREEVGTQWESDLQVAADYQIVERFLCIQDMVNCWHGKGRFLDLPFPGGLEEVERRFQNKWRRHMTNAEQVRYSRFRRIVICCGDDRDRIGLCEHVFKEKQSVLAVTEMIKNKGWVPSKSRKRNDPH